MPYVNKVTGYKDVERTMLFQGKEEKYMDMEAIEELVWETPWQPEHMPVDSVIRVKVAHMVEYQAVVLSHFRQDGSNWGVNLYNVDDGLWTSINSGWVTQITQRGDLGVVWNKEPEDHAYMHGYIVQPKKHHNSYHSMSMNHLVRTLLQVHPAFSYVRTDDHLYCIPDVVKELNKEFSEDRQEDQPYAPELRVNKKRFVKRMHLALSKNRTSRKEDQKFWDGLNSSMMEDSLLDR